MCVLGTELRGEPLGVEKRRQTRNDGALAVRLLLSSEPRKGGGAYGVSHQPVHPARIMRQGTIEHVEGFAVLREEIFGDAKIDKYPGVRAAQTERPFEPRHGLCGLACPLQNAAPRPIAFGIARVDGECLIDLCQSAIIILAVHADNGQQNMGLGGEWVERQRFFCQRLGPRVVILGKFGPPRDDRLVMRDTESGIGRGIIGVEIDRLLKERPRLGVGRPGRAAGVGMAAQNVFLSGKVCRRLVLDALLLQPGELYGGCSDDAAGDVVLYGKYILQLGIVDFRP